MREDKQHKVTEFDSGRGEYRNKNDEIVKQNSTGQRPDFSEEGVNNNNKEKANSLDRLENAEPFKKDPTNPLNKKIGKEYAKS